MDNTFTLTNRKTGEDLEVFMSFGLLQNLLTALGNNLEQVVALDLVPELAEPVIALLIAERDEKGNIIKNPTFDVSLEDAEAVFDWVKEHLVSYFLRRLSKTKTMFESRKEEMAQLGLSGSGTALEALKTASS